MGLLEVLGIRKKETNLEEELNKLKNVIEDHNSQTFEELKSDVKTIFSELQSMKLEQRSLENDKEKIDMRIAKLAEKMMEIDNEMLKVVYKDELNMLTNEFNHFQNDIKSIKESQTQITDKFIDFALKNKEEHVQEVAVPMNSENILTEFEQDILNKYHKNITSEQISSDTGMSKGHISRTLKALHKRGYLTRKRKGKEFIYDRK